MAFNVLKRIHYFFLRRKKPAGTCKMFELNLPTHNITCVVPDKGSCGIVHKKMPQRPLNNYRSVFLFLPPPSALPDSRNVGVSDSGRCREFAIPFSTPSQRHDLPVPSQHPTPPQGPARIILSLAPPSALPDSRNVSVWVSCSGSIFW